MEPELMRVLVVDDKRNVADSLALVLQASGFDCRAVYSGEDAAEVAGSWNPDAVIVDVMLGKMNGVELAIHLTQRLPSCKILLVSGSFASDQLLSESKRLGYEFPILAKPFHPDSIFSFLGHPTTALSA
jgi:CheY-like chemotaxis protein